MNTYVKYYPNVFVAKCTERHAKFEEIILTTKYGKEVENIVHNFLFEKDGFHYYSIVRSDGFNVQEWAKRKADRLNNASANASKKSTEKYEASKEGHDFLVLAEPIKIGHHSQKRHESLINRNYNRMAKSVEFDNKSKEYAQRAEYWEAKTEEINLSMPESIDYFAFKLEEAKERQEGLKSGKYSRDHSFSLPYATKAVKEMQSKYDTAVKLWQD
jgi:hypothetical protein